MILTNELITKKVDNNDPPLLDANDHAETILEALPQPILEDINNGLFGDGDIIIFPPDDDFEIPDIDPPEADDELIIQDDIADDTLAEIIANTQAAPNADHAGDAGPSRWTKWRQRKRLRSETNDDALIVETAADIISYVAKKI